MRRAIPLLAFLFLLIAVPVSAQEIGSFEIPLSIAVSPMNADNACLAGTYLDGVTIAPGEDFSFNDTVGRRTPDRGYKAGYIASTSHNEKDIGGGVCMTASILHQAVKRAGLEVLERHNHCIQISYLPLGEDAAVQYGVEDFRFRNSLTVPVTIRTTIGDSLKITITTEDKKVQVFNNGQIISFDTSPFIFQNVLLVPIEGIAQSTNSQLVWDANRHNILFNRGGTSICLTPGSTTVYVNNLEKQLAVPVRIVNNRTMVPLRFICQETGDSIEWDAVNRSAFITPKPDTDNLELLKHAIAGLFCPRLDTLASAGNSCPL